MGFGLLWGGVERGFVVMLRIQSQRCDAMEESFMLIDSCNAERSPTQHASDLLPACLPAYLPTYDSLKFNTRTALPPITAATVSPSSPKVPFTAFSFVLTLSHSVSPSSSGGKNG